MVWVLQVSKFLWSHKNLKIIRIRFFRGDVFLNIHTYCGVILYVQLGHSTEDRYRCPSRERSSPERNILNTSNIHVTEPCKMHNCSQFGIARAGSRLLPSVPNRKYAAMLKSSVRVGVILTEGYDIIFISSFLVIIMWIQCDKMWSNVYWYML